VREGFMDLARLEPARFVILNGMDTPEQIHQKIVVILENHQGQNQQ
jgi:thymidylate kinase